MEKIQKIKKEFVKLYDLKDDKKEYDKRLDELCKQIDKLKLSSLIDSFHVKFLFSVEMGNRLSRTSRNDFIAFITDKFQNKTSTFYFHKPELNNFPSELSLGFGKLTDYEMLPLKVREYARKIYTGEFSFDDSLISKAFGLHIHDNVAISDPTKGRWLAIQTSSITYRIRQEDAFNKAEESLDLLRLINSPYKLTTLQYALVLDEIDDKIYPASVPLTGLRYDYDADIEKDLNILNELCINTKNDLQHRIKNALYLKRIADNDSPDHLKILFYVAAIENLILGDNERDVLRWKFSQKGALILDDDPLKRQQISTELKHLYDLRSKIAHGGKIKYDFYKTNDAERYLRILIGRIIYLMNKENIYMISKKGKKNGKSLNEYIDKIIYSD